MPDRNFNIIVLRCIICGRAFPRHKRPKRHHSGMRSGACTRGIRDSRSLTCSPKCSRIYTIIRDGGKHAEMPSL